MAQNTTRNDGNAVDWRDELQVRAKVDEWAAGEQAQSQRTDYVESRILGLIRSLSRSSMSPFRFTATSRPTTRS